jgi:PAS domain S-box-containing protein
VLEETIDSTDCSATRAALANAFEAVVVIGARGRIEFFNAAAERLFGYQAGDVVGRKLSLLFPSPGREVLECYLGQFFIDRGRAAVGIGRPAEGIRRDGTVFPLRLLACPLQLDADTFTGLVRDESHELRLHDTLARNSRLLTLVSRAQSLAFSDRSSQEVFGELLEVLLEATESEFGFIAESRDDQAAAYLKSLAVFDIAWNEETRALYRAGMGGIEFRNLDTLFGAVATGRRPVIANRPEEDERGCGLPPGHPPLKSFMGLPFFHEDRLVGVAGVANRQGGYSHELARHMEPLLGICAQSVKFRTSERLRLEAEREANDARAEADSARLASENLAELSERMRTSLTSIVTLADVMQQGTAEPAAIDAARKIKDCSRELADLVAQLLDPMESTVATRSAASPGSAASPASAGLPICLTSPQGMGLPQLDWVSCET